MENEPGAMPAAGLQLDRRSMGSMALGLAGAAMLPADRAAAAQLSVANGSASPKISAAIASFDEQLAACRQAIRSAPYYNRSERVRTQAEYYLQQAVAGAFATVTAPRAHLPWLLTDTFLAPLTFNHTGPNPDVRYMAAFLDGRQTYRLWGKRNTSPFAYIAVNTDHWVPESRQIAFRNLDHFKFEADGSFEIILSATPHDGNWITLDANSSSHEMLIRLGSFDATKEHITEFHIEPVDIDQHPTASFDFTEDELAARIVKAGRSVRFVTDVFTIGIPRTYYTRAGNRYNAFASFDGKEQATGGAAPVTIHGGAFFEFEPGEALIVECDAPKSIDWSIQARDPWLQLPDYVYHQSVLNMHTMRIDADGKFRAVVSLVDPGVPNWLDSAGMTFGCIQYRFYDSAYPPKATITRVPLAELRQHLPAETPTTTPEERTAALRQRRRHMRALFGR